MGYFKHFTQHIIEIIPEEDATIENYKRIGEVMHYVVPEGMQPNMLIHDGIMDDSNFGKDDEGCIIRGAGVIVEDYCHTFAYCNDISFYVPDLKIRFYVVEEWEYGFAQKATFKGGNCIDWPSPLDTDYFYSIYGIINSECHCAYAGVWGEEKWFKDLPSPNEIPRYKN